MEWSPMQQTILIVDDEAPVRAYLRAALARQGLRVFEAANGFDALAMLRHLEGAVDLLITDIKMPGMTGTDLVKAVKMAQPQMPVIYISGEPLGQELHDPMHGILFLQKPLMPQALIDAVREVSMVASDLV